MHSKFSFVDNFVLFGQTNFEILETHVFKDILEELSSSYKGQADLLLSSSFYLALIVAISITQKKSG